MEIRKKLMDELLKDVDPKQVFASEGLMTGLKKALAERMLNAEMDHHLDQEVLGESPSGARGNHRNGYSKKFVLTDSGAMGLDIPRDRRGTFEPQLIATVTDGVLEDVGRWQSRPLEALYVLVFFDADAIRVKMRDEGSARSKAVYLAIGVAPDGRKEALGIWIEQNEGEKFRMRVVSTLRNHGVQDILIAIVDGLKGFPDAINAVFAHTQIQTCIVHLLRNSLEYVGWKKHKAVALALKAIYRASDADVAALALNEFEESSWGQRFPAITTAWRRAWTQVIPFFAYPPEVRRMLYTTNQIEALNSKIRRSVRARGHFPSDEAAMKLIWLQLRGMTKDWKMPAREWHTARAQFALMFGDRFEAYS